MRTCLRGVDGAGESSRRLRADGLMGDVDLVVVLDRRGCVVAPSSMMMSDAGVEGVLSVLSMLLVSLVCAGRKTGGDGNVEGAGTSGRSLDPVDGCVPCLGR